MKRISLVFVLMTVALLTKAQSVDVEINNALKLRVDTAGRLQLFNPNVNLFIGQEAGRDNTTGQYNYFIGYRAGAKNTTGILNYFAGHFAGTENTTGSGNFFLGSFCGTANTTGSSNFFVGQDCGRLNTTGVENQFFGYVAGQLNTTGNANLFIGHTAGRDNTIGSRNFFVGFNAGARNVAANDNHFVGYRAGNFNTTGYENHFQGNEAGFLNTTGFYNYFNGLRAGRNNTTGADNYFSGSDAGRANTTGNLNHFAGNASGYVNTTGSNNHFSGYFAGFSNTTGSSNMAIGYHADVTAGDLTKAAAIGYNAKVSRSNSFVIGGTGADTVNVGIGTTSPIATLDVHSNETNSDVAIFRSTGGWAQIFVYQGTTTTDLGAYATGGYVGTHSAGDFKLRTGSVDRVFIEHPTGNVGIGTTSPTDKLHVAGDVAIDGIIKNEIFQVVPLLNGYANLGPPFAAALFYKDKEGVVHLTGVVSTSSASASHMFTLPPGYRPIAGGMLLFPALNSSNSLTRIEVRPDGLVSVGAFIGGWLSLDGISFRAN